MVVAITECNIIITRVNFCIISPTKLCLQLIMIITFSARDYSRPEKVDDKSCLKFHRATVTYNKLTSQNFAVLSLISFCRSISHTRIFSRQSIRVTDSTLNLKFKDIIA